jgi:hypothetical protein
MFTLELELSYLGECQFLISILKTNFLKINKMKISFKHISYFLLFILGINMTLISCTSDLDVTPGDDDEFYLKLSFKIQHHTNKY